MSPSLPRRTLAEALSARLQAEWLTGGVLSTLLLPLSFVYGLAAMLRARMLQPAELPVPVIVVGNWIVGGAGKTPTLLALLEHLKARGLRAGVVSRGYRREGDGIELLGPDSTAQSAGDEPLLVHLRGHVPVAVGRDRVAAARALLAAHPEIQLIVSDDGLQHLRLPRALSVLVFDERGVGNGRLLPAGPLRQAPRWTPAADEIVVYNAARPSTRRAGHLGRRRLRGAVRLQDWWAGRPAEAASLAALRQGTWTAVAGVARPQRFFDMLSDLGLHFEPLPQPDHASYAELPWPAGAQGVLLTEKDAVKIRPERVGALPVWVLPLDFAPGPEFLAELDTHLNRLLPHGSTPDRTAGLPPVQGPA